ARAEQVVVTARDFSGARFRLVELNADVEQALRAGDRVFIVGEPHERAVLCTPAKSFFLAKEDTSNLRLLTRHTAWSAPEPTDGESASGRREIVVHGSARSHFVLQPKGPDVMRLKALLMESPFEHTPSDESASAPQKRAKRHKLHTTEDLVLALQASEQEVLAMLEQLHAFNDAGAWWLLSAAYQSRVFGDLLDAIVQNDWDCLAPPGIPLARLQAALDHPLVALRQCCKIYGAVVDGDGEERCTLEASKVAGFVARQLFEEQAAAGSDGDGWALEQFMDKWALRVPDSVAVSAAMLRGVALTKTGKGKAARVVYFPEEDLPLDAKQRFEKLFQVQEKWTLEQLEPFIQSLVVPGTTQAALLLKHTRSSRQVNSSERLYSRR
ncbi:hypothetical protein PybrP1_008575, partial [[Pythium] brassicae (nom. inval.)]